MAVLDFLTAFFTYLYERIVDWAFGQPKVDSITKKCVFITGCDRGFGKALAKKLDILGVKVFAGCYTRDGSEALNNETSARCHTVQVDVTDTESIEQAFDFVKTNLETDQGSPLWGVVNNAGVVTGAGPSEFCTRAEWKAAYEVNAIGPAEVNRVFLPMMKKSKGRMVTIASVAGRIAFADAGTYCASKFALEGYLEGFRRDMVKWGISVHTLEPSFYKTEIVNPESWNERRKRRFNAQSEDIQKEYGQEWLDKSLEVEKAFLEAVSDPNIDEVVDAYIHALFAMYPKTRYIVGKPSRMMLLNSMLPDYITDILFKDNPSLPAPKILQK